MHLLLENWNCNNNVKERPCKDETFDFFGVCVMLIYIYYAADIFVGENILFKKMYFSHGILIQLLKKCVTWTDLSQEISFGKVKKPCSSITKSLQINLKYMSLSVFWQTTTELPWMKEVLWVETRGEGTTFTSGMYSIQACAWWYSASFQRSSLLILSTNEYLHF